jgi:formylglycine-generating enzyme required for sulfatase activity
MLKQYRLITAALLSTLLVGSVQAAENGTDIPMVKFNKFEIGKTEVTQGQWKAVMGANPSKYDYCGDNCPVDNVSWEDAKHFIKQLNKKTGKEYRLPTESEWESACYANGSSTDEFCGGADLDKLGWYDMNSGGETKPVAQKKPNALGIYDMTGNVWEWLEDKGDDKLNSRVLRGGSWNSTRDATSGNRSILGAKARMPDTGFRLVRTIP